MRVLAHREGLFGPIRVLERQSDGARLYCVKSSVQTMVQRDGVSVFGYVHSAKLLLKSARNVLLIGGGGGSLATMLAREGCSVTVIDVDPAAEDLARTYFGLDKSVRWLTTEPLAFIETCKRRFDAVVVDACDADGLVAPFDDANALLNVLRRACPKGSLVLNLVHEDGAPPWGRSLAKQIAARGVNVTLYRAEEGWEGNEILHVRANGPTDVLFVPDVSLQPSEARTYLMSLRAYTPAVGRSDSDKEKNVSIGQAPTPIRPLGRAIARGFIGRCPACGRGAVIRGYISPVGACGSCGENLARYQSADFAPYIVTFLIGLVFTPLTFVLSLNEALGDWALYVTVAFALLAAILLLPRTKGAAIGLLWALDVPNA